MKRLLIISPYFPPVNAADMQRVRTSLSYFGDFGWETELVTVDPAYVELPKDDLLAIGIPENVEIHRVKALKKKWTSKFGMGSIAYRSLWYYRQAVNKLLGEKKIDLIYFSTTQFPVCVLGPYWKKKFNIPFVIDMQDPWHSDYYQDKPKEQRPPKYWLSYRLNKYLEELTMKQVSGLISVSESYIDNLRGRYPWLTTIPSETLTFGAFESDIDIVNQSNHKFAAILNPGFKNLVYIGRGGLDMHNSIRPVFEAIKRGLAESPKQYRKILMYFIGTSYAPNGKGVPTIVPLAKEYGIEENIVEITDRIGYFHTLYTLGSADALFIAGSDDPKYTASKIFPYILTKKPLLAIFNSASSAINILQEFGAQNIYSYNKTGQLDLRLESFFKHLIDDTLAVDQYNLAAVETYGARNMTRIQCNLFDKVIDEEN